jgi:hypothetical protein
MSESKKAVQFKDPVLDDEDKAYVASGGIVMSVSSKNLQLPMREEGVALLGADGSDVNRYGYKKRVIRPYDFFQTTICNLLIASRILSFYFCSLFLLMTVPDETQHHKHQEITEEHETLQPTPLNEHENPTKHLIHFNIH